MVDRRPPAALRDARLIVVVRPDLDVAARSALTDARRRGARVIADYDDLLFAGDPAEHPLVMNGSLDASACARRIATQHAALDFFDGFTVSTRALYVELCRLTAKPVTLVPNGLSAWWVEQGRVLHSGWRPGESRIIRYLAGSPSHDADLAGIASPLSAFLRAHTDIRLELVGPVAVSDGGFPHEQVQRAPRVPYVDLPRLIASSWVTLAPLTLTPFNACRSAIKLLESGAFAAPCIATPIGDMLHHRESGVLLARDEGDWFRALSALLKDDYRLELGRRSKRWVDRHGFATTGAETLSSLLASCP